MYIYYYIATIVTTVHDQKQSFSNSGFGKGGLITVRARSIMRKIKNSYSQ